MSKTEAAFPSAAASFVADRQWVISDAGLAQICSRLASEGVPRAVLPERGERPPESWGSNIRRFGRTAVLNIVGPIFRRQVDAWWFDGVSIEQLGYDIEVLIGDGDTERIILNVDSPGGEANGCHELGEIIFAARAKKEIVSYVGGRAASGGVWLASSASRIVADRTAQLGSVGVVLEYWDIRKILENLGYRQVQIVSDQSPDKRADPLEAAGRAKYQALINSMGAIFVETVARNRGVSPDHVQDKFGKGFMLMAEDAREVGLIDEIGLMKSLLNNKEEGGSAQMAEPNGAANTPTTYSAEELKSAFPDAAQALIQEGEERGRAAGLTAEACEKFREEGALKERERIQGCFKVLKSATALAVHDDVEEKLMAGASRGDLAEFVLEGREKYHADLKKNHKTDAEEIGNVTWSGDETPGSETVEEALMDKLAADCNDGMEGQF